MIEVKLLFSIFKKHLTRIFFVTLLFSLISFVYASGLSASYESLITVYIQKDPEEPESGDFTFDGYYAQQAAEGFTDTVVGFFESPAVALHALELAKETSTSEEVKSFQKRTKIEKVAPQLINVTVKDDNPEKSNVLVDSLLQAVSESASSIGTPSTGKVNVAMVTKEPLVHQKNPSSFVYALVGAAFGFLGSYVVSFVMEMLPDNGH